jgi:hypothetical protein
MRSKVKRFASTMQTACASDDNVAPVIGACEWHTLHLFDHQDLKALLYLAIFQRRGAGRTAAAAGSDTGGPCPSRTPVLLEPALLVG